MDREKVIEAFDKAKELVWADDDEYTVGYNKGLEKGKNIALALLKKQQPKPVAYPETNYQGFPVSHCPTCNECIDRKAYGGTKQQNFCPYCGQAVKWRKYGSKCKGKISAWIADRNQTGNHLSGCVERERDASRKENNGLVQIHRQDKG